MRTLTRSELTVKVLLVFITTNWNLKKIITNHLLDEEDGAMPEKILIFGKDAWPYTRAAREAYAKQNKDVEYLNVASDPDQLDVMLKHSNGARKVPVIVEGGEVTIGFDGGTWGVWFLQPVAEKIRYRLFVTACWLLTSVHRSPARPAASRSLLFSWLKCRYIIAKSI